MIKLSDIIKSGGGNAKLNRFINRYVLSKKEKKNIINAVKEDVESHYYVFTDTSRYSDYFGQNKPALSQSSINLLYSILSIIFKTNGYVYTASADYTGSISIRQLDTDHVPYSFMGIFKNTQLRLIDYEFSYIDRIPRYTDVVIKNFEELIEFMSSQDMTEQEREAFEEIKNGIKRITEKEFNEFIDELSKKY